MLLAELQMSSLLFCSPQKNLLLQVLPNHQQSQTRHAGAWAAYIKTTHVKPCHQTMRTEMFIFQLILLRSIKLWVWAVPNDFVITLATFLGLQRHLDNMFSIINLTSGTIRRWGWGGMGNFNFCFYSVLSMFYIGPVLLLRKEKTYHIRVVKHRSILAPVAGSGQGLILPMTFL